MASNNPAAAEQSAAAILAQNPSNPAALMIRAQARSAQGNTVGALTDAQQALALNPQDPETQALVHQLQNQQAASSKVNGGLKGLDFGPELSAGAAPEGGAAAGAAKAPGAGGPASVGVVDPRMMMETAAAGAPANLRNLFNTAELQLGLRDFTGAILTLQRAHDLAPDNESVLNVLARTSNAANNPLGAIAAADKALLLNPQDAAALREKAYGEMTLGQLEAALADVNHSIQLTPRYGLGYLYRAMIEEKLGKTDAAKQDYEAARSFDATLAPLTQAALNRLNGGGADGRFSPSRRTLFRGGAIALSTLLIVLGLMGTATGRMLTSRFTGRAAEPVAVAAEAYEGPAATITAGQFLGGHYRVIRELGRGGMGVVYQAFDETLRRPVAIKQLQREGRSSPEELQRFLREAQLVAQLRHPHIAEIHSVIGGGDLMLVFEYIEGKSLAEVMTGGRRLQPADVQRLVSEIAGALDYAHERKIVHRDLKPANVMIAMNGGAKVMDFGIAHQSRSGAEATRTNYISGTPPYMSPEQMMGSVSRAVDVYALGVMTYEMLTGRLPFDGPDYMEQKVAKRYAPAATLTALPPEVDVLIAHALEPDPTKRIASARDFARGFARAFGATPSRVS